MALFSNSRKRLAQQTAQRLLAGHTTLTVFWALKHAGVLAAMLPSSDPLLPGGTVAAAGGRAKGGIGIEPHDFAAAKAMAPDILAALCEYLAQQELLLRDGSHYELSELGLALLEHDDGVLEHLRAHQPILDMVEHLLARLKTYGHGVSRRADTLLAGQNVRWDGEVLPTLQDQVKAAGAACVLDLSCGNGELLIRLAKERKSLLGVGISADGAAVRQANERIATTGLEKRLIVVPALALDICHDPRKAFDRVGISPQLWEKFDAIIAAGLFSDLSADQETRLTTTLRGLAQEFSAKHPIAIFLVEVCAGTNLDQNYYAPEMKLLAALMGVRFRTTEQWKQMLQSNGLQVRHTTPLQTDGLTIFSCTAPRRVPPVVAPVAVPAEKNRATRPAPKPAPSRGGRSPG